ncbi:maternal protein pumilio-like [Drosophila obscura]|uniref:maternal protein pumilio-like n=1 Tax=Drosophila obscura TaxID=7282 RepID=UPI000BA07AC9|nr:maternal protein pumilio-like [Drosophila obscura]XP_022222647.1 maternal protein pumilio-like [Drosophila obscura]
MKYFLSIIFGALSLTAAQYFGDGGMLGGNPYGHQGPQVSYGQQQQQQPQTQDYFSGGFGYGYGPSFAAGLDQLQHQQPQQQQQQQQPGPYFFGPYGG